MTHMKYKLIASDSAERFDTRSDRFTVISSGIRKRQGFIDSWAGIALGSSVKPSRVIRPGRGVYGDAEIIGQDMYRVLGTYIGRHDLDQNADTRHLRVTNISDLVA